MTRIKDKIEETIKSALQNLNIEAANFAVEHPENLSFGDYSTNVAMVVAKGLGKNPFDIASEISGSINGNLPDFVEKVEALRPGFINFHLSSNFLLGSVGSVLEEGEKFGHINIFDGKRVVVEHTQPNPFKEFHIGHLMNNAIGESIARVFAASNADTLTVGYHGDVGIHVAKAIWGFLVSPEGEYHTQEAIKDMLTAFTSINLSGFANAYARGNTAFETDEKAKKEITEINKKIYDKSDALINEVYEKGKSVSLSYFDHLYRLLDSKFEDHFYESQTGEIGREIVRQNIGKIFEESDGAVVFRGENFEPKTHTRVFLNKGGLPTYEAKEIGLAKIKMDKFAPYEMSVTITANEQDSFFEVVEVAIGEVFPEIKGKLKHLSHGMLKLPSGKMSSRTGTVITAESLIAQVKESIHEKIRASKHVLLSAKIKEEEVEKMVEQVAIGAIKFSILRQSVGGDIVFDFDKSISFDGDSGPYLQYTAVRAKSVLEKAAQIDPNYNTQKMSKGTFDIAVGNSEKLLYRFPEVVERSAKDLSPHHIVTYLTDLAGEYNSFYAHNQIIDTENKELTSYRLALTKAVQITLTNGLHLLGIKVPERM